jgi:hypothetical protein
MALGVEELRDRALAALEEAAACSRRDPVERTKALGFALAFLWAYCGGDRAIFVWFWRSLPDPNAIGRSQNVNASLNAIYRALGLERG